MRRAFSTFIIVALLIASTSLAAKRGRKMGPRPGRRNIGGKQTRGMRFHDTPKTMLLLKAESNINIQLVRATSVEAGFPFVQGAEGFIATAKEWVDGKFVQTVPTDSQILDVQKRSVVLRNLIPGREYLIQVQGLDKSRKPFGQISGKVVRTAQMCYVCNGVEENSECDKERDQIECPHDKDACANVVRFDNNKMSISKRCAQYDPTHGDRLSDDVSRACHGRENMQDSACRCMCRSNLCNKQMLPCVDECMDELPMPLQSSLKCTNGRKVGSVCRWECAKDFVLKGLGSSKCRPDKTWSVMSPPQCIHVEEPKSTKVTGTTRSKTCPVLLSNESTKVSCPKGNKQSSVCKLNCKSGYTAEGGSTQRTCKNGKWTGSPLVCREIKCPAVDLRTGDITCSNSTKIGSVCDVTTPSTITCQSDGSWTSSDSCSPYAKGDARKCPPIPAPAYGAIQCTNEHKDGSLCESTCARGYAAIGATAVRECRNGKWIGEAIECKQITCGNLANLPYVSDVIQCSNRDAVGSICEVTTPAAVTCQANGSWSLPFNPASRCKECKCP